MHRIEGQIDIGLGTGGWKLAHRFVEAIEHLASAVERMERKEPDPGKCEKCKGSGWRMMPGGRPEEVCLDCKGSGRT